MWFPLEFCNVDAPKKPEWCTFHVVEKVWRYDIRLDAVPQRDRRTDGRTDSNGKIYRTVSILTRDKN